MATVELRHVTKVFPGDVTALDDLSLAIEDGEFVVFVGPSGCGKSTALRLIAGLEDVTGGDILIGGERVNQRAPQQRNIAMVFQNYALYPHKTVRKNLEFPLRMMRVDRQERDKRVREAARLLGLAELLERKPKELSGGQRQRVAMGRAIVRDPMVFLMDEPLSNLDAKLRVEIRAEIAALQERIGITTIYVTHDQVEAMTLGQRVAVMRDGRLQQVAPAQELYERPMNVFVASFIGSPRMNIFRTTLRTTENGQSCEVDFGTLRLPVRPERVRNPERLTEQIGQPVLAGLRPETFAIATDAMETQSLKAAVRATEALGYEEIVYCEPPVEMIEGRDGGTPGNGVQGQTEAALIARLPAGRTPRLGEPITLGVDARKLHLFDADGAAI